MYNLVWLCFNKNVKFIFNYFSNLMSECLSRTSCFFHLIFCVTQLTIIVVDETIIIIIDQLLLLYQLAELEPSSEKVAVSHSNQGSIWVEFNCSLCAWNSDQHQ